MTIASLRSPPYREYQSLTREAIGIRDAFDNLRACKFTYFHDGIKKTESLIEAIRNVESIRPILKNRLVKFASMLEVCLKNHATEDSNVRVGQIVVTIVNIKNPLLIEAALFGKLYPYLKRRYSFYCDPNYYELHDKFPNLFSYLDFKTIDQGYYSINLEFLRRLYDELIVVQEDPLFNQLTYDYFEAFEKTDDQDFLKIPFKALPHKSFLERSKQLDPSKCKILSQFFSLIFKEEEVLWLTHYFAPLDEQLEQIIVKRELLPITRDKKSKLIPCFNALVKEYEIACSKGLTFTQMLQSEEHIKNIYAKSEERWLTDAALVYELALEVEVCVKRINYTNALSICNEKIFYRGRIVPLIEWADMIPKLSDKINYPLSSSNPYCTSKEEFMHLPLYAHFYKLLKEYRVKEPVAAPKINTDWLIGLDQRKQTKKKPKNTLQAAAAGAGAASADPVIDEEGDSLSRSLENPNQGLPEDLLIQITKPSEPSQDNLTRKINESLQEAKSLLANVCFSERVSDFWISTEKGLSHRGMKGLDPSDRLVDEMIKTHDFPHQILHYACNKLYAQKIEIERPDSQNEIQYYSMVEIDSKTYDLEVALCQMRSLRKTYILYHLFARERKIWEKPQNAVSSQETDSEEDTGEFQLASVDSNFFTVDEFGNAKCEYRGRQIKIFIRKK